MLREKINRNYTSISYIIIMLIEMIKIETITDPIQAQARFLQDRSVTGIKVFDKL